jgi:hypothetical protein
MVDMKHSSTQRTGGWKTEVQANANEKCVDTLDVKTSFIIPWKGMTWSGSTNVA